MTKSTEKKAIVLFSGGKDSFLTTCLIIESGFKVSMVCFETFAGIASENAKHGVDRIIVRYGIDKAEFLGVYSNVGIWREFVFPFLNMTPSQILAEFGEITTSQFNCLTCRSAMYTWVIIKAKQMGINVVADGARKSQGFVIELPCMMRQFSAFFAKYGITLMFPIADLKSDWRLKNLLLARGFVPKVVEPQCLIGASLPGGQKPSKETQDAVVQYFDKVVGPKMNELISVDFPITSQGLI
ncbi:hypothetical protein KKC00_00065 [Patescibacteria group bacterium]|nr:hypothetical protein [Patescibacteria group bacterium]